MWNHFKPLIFAFGRDALRLTPFTLCVAAMSDPRLSHAAGRFKPVTIIDASSGALVGMTGLLGQIISSGTTRLATGRGKAERVLQDNDRHAGGGNARLATLLQRRRPCIVPASKIATVERVNAATMHRAAEYKDNAQECRELAKRMLRRDDSDALERIAQIWERLAKLPERQPEPESELPITR